MAGLFKRGSDVPVLAVMLLFGLWLAAVASSIFKPGFLTSGDHSLQYYKCWYLVNVLIPRYGQVIGWDQNAACGYPVHQFWPPLFNLMVVSIHYASLTLIPLEVAYKLAVLFVFLLPTVSIYAFMRDLGLPSASYLFSAFLPLIDIGRYFFIRGAYVIGGGMTLLFVFGMPEQALAVGLMPLAFMFFGRALVAFSVRNAVFTGVVMALVALSYPSMAYGGIVGLALYAGLFIYQSRGCVRGRVADTLRGLLKVLVAAVVFFVSLSAFWVVPLFFKRGFSSSAGQEPMISLLDLLGLFDFTSRAPLMDRFILVAGFVGLLFALYRRDRRVSLVVALLVLFLGFSFGFGPLYGLLPLKWGLKAERFIVPLRVVWFMLAGYGFSQVTDLSVKLGSKIGAVAKAFPRVVEAGWGRYAATILFAGLILGYPTLSAYRYVDTNVITALTLYDDPQLPSLMKLYAWLSANVPEGARIDWPRFLRGGYYHFIGSVMFAGRPTVFFWNPEATGLVFDYLYPVYHDVWFPLFAQDADPTRFNMTEVHDRLKTVGVSVLVTEASNVKVALGMHPNLFEKVHDVDDFSIFYIKDPELGYVKVLDSGGARVEGVEVEPELIRFVIKGCEPRTTVLVRVSYFPNWKAFANGREIEVRADEATGLMLFTLDAVGDVTVKLVYTSLWFEQAAAALTLVSIPLLLFVLMPRSLAHKAVDTFGRLYRVLSTSKGSVSRHRWRRRRS